MKLHHDVDAATLATRTKRAAAAAVVVVIVVGAGTVPARAKCGIRHEGGAMRPSAQGVG